MEREYSHGKDEAFLRTLIRQTGNFARLEGSARPDEKLQLRIGASKFRLVPGEKKNICEIPGTSKEWEKNDLLRGKIMLFFLCRAFSFAPEELAKIPALEELPFWLIAAMDEARKNMLSAGVYSRNNRDLAALRALVFVTGKFPDFSVLSAAKEELSGQSEMRVFRQESLLLAELFCRERRMKDYLHDILAERSFPYWLSRFPSAEAAHRSFSGQAHSLLWSRLASIPSALLEQRISTLKECQLPVVDEKGVTSLKTLPVSEAALLMTQENPLTPRWRKILSAKCSSFAAQASPGIVRAARILAAAAEKLSPDPDTMAEYSDRWQKLAQTIWKEKEKELFFQQEAHRAMPLIPLWQERFQALSPGNAAMSEAVETFLKKAEKAYFSEY